MSTARKTRREESFACEPKLLEKRNQKIDAQIESMAEYAQRYVPLLQRAKLLRASPLAAIKAKCQACVGYEDAVNRIHDCSTYVCPLWGYRPYQAGAESSAEE